MAAFRPSNAASAPPSIEPPVDPTTREEMLDLFGRDVVVQAERIVQDAINGVHRGRAYFRERDIIRAAQRIAEKEIPIEVLEHPHFKTMLEVAFRAHTLVALDQRGTVTTPEMWEKEQMMLSMAGEATVDHLIPKNILDNALATRTWIPSSTLPNPLMEAVRMLYPNAGDKMVEVRAVVAAATSMGLEVYGAGLTWNREGATGLTDDQVGTPEEFVQAIDDSRASGQDWFIKPTLFICDDWDTPEAKALAERAQSSSQPVALTLRTGISDEQAEAVIAATRTKTRVTVIEGKAGAGKSFTMKSVYEAYMACGYDVMGAALGWSAAKVLSGSTGLPEKSCRAMTGFLNSLKRAEARGAQFFTRPTLIIVDEAGMVGTRYMYDLLAITRRSRYPIKIILTGDSLQVAPVDAGNALEAIIHHHGTTRIETIRRQKQESHRTAVHQFSARQSGKALYPFVHQEAIRWSKDKNDMFNRVVQDFVSYRAAFPEKKALILALKNEDVNELNRRIRLVYKKAGFIQPNEVNLEVTDGQRGWRSGFSVGDEVVLRANDQNLPTYHVPEPGTADLYDEETWQFKTTGVFNRNSGRIVGIRRAAKPAGSYDFIIDLEGEEGPSRVVVNSQTFKHDERPGMPMVHNFATTIYASQGQTVSKVLMLDSDMMNFRLAYVGMSRHTESVDVYLNETELHLRLDQTLGKSPSRPVRNVNPDHVSVELGRYSRSEMLQTVALTWGQDAANLTATMYEIRARLGHSFEDEASVKERIEIKASSLSAPVVDFIPSINVSYPLVDIEKVLSLPDPVSTSEFIRPSDTEDNRKAVPTYESPIRIKPTSSLPGLPPTLDEDSGLFSKAAGWLTRRSRSQAPPDPETRKPTRSESFGNVKPQAPFHRSGVDASKPAAELPDSVSAVERMVGKVSEFLASATPKPKGIEGLPFIPQKEPLGRVDENGVLRFDGVPQTQAPEGQGIPCASDDFLVKGSGRTWWDVGRGGEPRILARWTGGEVRARYSLDGKCVVGDGLPPIAFNPNPSDATPVHIVPGPREWLMMQELYESKYKDNPRERPHLIWGAQDADWKHIASQLNKRKIVILRSKYDEGQIPWAQDLHRELTERWALSVSIAPRVPSPAPRAPGRRGP